MLSIACCDILCAVLLSVIYVYMFMSVLKAHKSLCYLLLNMPTLNKAYCIVLYCIVFNLKYATVFLCFIAGEWHRSVNIECCFPSQYPQTRVNNTILLSTITKYIGVLTGTIWTTDSCACGLSGVFPNLFNWNREMMSKFRSIGGLSRNLIRNINHLGSLGQGIQ